MCSSTAVTPQAAGNATQSDSNRLALRRLTGPSLTAGAAAEMGLLAVVVHGGRDDPVPGGVLRNGLGVASVAGRAAERVGALFRAADHDAEWIGAGAGRRPDL